MARNVKMVTMEAAFELSHRTALSLQPYDKKHPDVNRLQGHGEGTGNKYIQLFTGIWRNSSKVWS